MIVLCSNGLTSKAICEAIEPKFKALHTAALVVTADYEYKKENYHVSRCVTELQRFGLTVSLIDIDDVDYNGPIISDHSSKNYREHGKIQQESEKETTP